MMDFPPTALTPVVQPTQALLLLSLSAIPISPSRYLAVAIPTARLPLHPSSSAVPDPLVQLRCLPLAVLIRIWLSMST